MENVSALIIPCSKQNHQIYQHWFNFADSDGDGRLSGNDVDTTKFFSMSNLSRPQLKQNFRAAMSAGSARRVLKGFMGTVAAYGGLLFVLQMLHDSRSECIKSLEDRYNDTDIRKALAVHRELKRNGKD